MERLVGHSLVVAALLTGCRIGYDPCTTEDERCTLATVEAESATLVAPFEVAFDPVASGGAYVIDGNAEGRNGQGEAELTFFLDTDSPHDLHIFARVVSSSNSTDSFFVSVDGAAAFPFHNANCSHSEEWHWTSMNESSGCPGETRPRLFTLSPGMHTLKLTSREGQSIVDKFALRVPATEP